MQDTITTEEATTEKTEIKESQLTSLIEAVIGTKLEQALAKFSEAKSEAVEENKGKAAAADKEMKIEVGADRLSLDPKGGYEYLYELAKDVYRNSNKDTPMLSPKLKAWKRAVISMGKTAGHMAEGDDAQGGALVPTEFAKMLLEKAIDVSVFYDSCTFMPMGTNKLDIPAIDETARTSNLFGGVKVHWTEEAGQKTETKPKFRTVQLVLHKLTGLCYASDEILEDSPMSLEPILTKKFGDALSFYIDEALFDGSGAGEPLGVLNSGALIPQTAEAGQVINTINYQNIIKMFSRMVASSLPKAKWYINQNTIPQIFSLALPVGAGGSAAMIVQGGLPDAPAGSILGRPIVITEHCKTLGTVGDIVFADYSEYLIGAKQKNVVKVDTSIHLAFDYDETAFRFVARLAGQPWWRSALTPLNGSTVSPFVALATRP